MNGAVEQAAEKTVNEKDQQTLLQLKVRHSDLTRMRDGHLAQAQNLVSPLNETMQQMAALEQKLFGNKQPAARAPKVATKKK